MHIGFQSGLQLRLGRDDHAGRDGGELRCARAGRNLFSLCGSRDFFPLDPRPWRAYMNFCEKLPSLFSALRRGPAIRRAGFGKNRTRVAAVGGPVEEVRRSAVMDSSTSLVFIFRLYAKGIAGCGEKQGDVPIGAQKKKSFNAEVAGRTAAEGRGDKSPSCLLHVLSHLSVTTVLDHKIPLSPSA